MISLGTYSKLQDDKVQSLLDERAGLYEKLIYAQRLLKEKQQLADDPELPMAASRRAEVESANVEELQEQIAADKPRFEAVTWLLAGRGYTVSDQTPVY